MKNMDKGLTDTKMGADKVVKNAPNTKVVLEGCMSWPLGYYRGQLSNLLERLYQTPRNVSTKLFAQAQKFAISMKIGFIGRP